MIMSNPIEKQANIRCGFLFLIISDSSKKINTLAINLNYKMQNFTCVAGNNSTFKTVKSDKIYPICQNAVKW